GKRLIPGDSRLNTAPHPPTAKSTSNLPGTVSCVCAPAVPAAAASTPATILLPPRAERQVFFGPAMLKDARHSV
ncbi:unnamed protein product, partial [Ectocarpus sp. 12 AP-2014]